MRETTSWLSASFYGVTGEWITPPVDACRRAPKMRQSATPRESENNSPKPFYRHIAAAIVLPLGRDNDYGSGHRTCLETFK